MSKKRLMKTAEYADRYFCEGSKPAASTIRRWIENGDLPGERIGKVYYVDVGKLEKTGNQLVDRVLQAS